jgi:polyhydroxyalkanoate synthesis regulator phasin
LASVRDEVGQRPVVEDVEADQLENMAALRAEVEELRRAVQALQQGATA